MRNATEVKSWSTSDQVARNSERSMSLGMSGATVAGQTCMSGGTARPCPVEDTMGQPRKHS